MQAVLFDGELYVVIVGEQDALIEIAWRALDEIGRRPATARNEVCYARDHVTFVIVNVSRAYQKLGVRSPSGRRHIIPQCNLIRSRFIFHPDMFLYVSYRRMVQSNYYEIN